MDCKALIFDIDGTLWDSRALVAQGYNRQLCAEGLEHLCVDAEILKKLFGKVMTEIADILLESIPAPERYALMDRCMASEDRLLHEDPCDIAYPGVAQTIRALAKKYRLFIVSNSQSGYPQLCIRKLKVEDCIEGHLCFGDTGTSKGQTLLRLMREHNITSCAYVGDTQGDYEATLEAGIPFIWAEYGFGTPEGYAAKIGSFPQLLDL
ncbi:MAG: HAD family hydrolase [Oscillospiraceae bacterium]|nr:HAD family hydrolase [Oscillospiraceae bacterium]